MIKFVRNTLASAAFAIVGLVGTQAAALTFPTFTVDMSESSVSVDGNHCILSCGVSARINPSLSDASFTPTAATGNGIFQINNFIQWMGQGYELGSYNVAVNLAFSSPDLQQSSTSGSGVFLSLSGIVVGGAVFWDQLWSTVAFDQGSVLKWRVASNGHGLPTALQVGYKTLVPMNTPSPIPLPASLPIIAVFIAGAAALGRRRAKGSAATA